MPASPSAASVAAPSAATRWPVWAALGVVYVVWGSTYLAIRWTVATMPALLSAGVRFAVAGALMCALLSVVRGRPAWRMTRAEAGHAALCGTLTLCGGNGMVVLAETHIPSGLAALLVAAVPLWLIVLRRVGGEAVSARTVAGVVVGLVGVALLFLPGGHGGATDPRYAALVLAAAFSWSLGSLLATRLAVPAEPMALAAVEMLAGGAALLALSVAVGDPGRVQLARISPRSWLSLAYLIVFGSLLAFSAYVWVFGHAPPSLVATYAYVNPVVAVALGVALAGERLSGVEILGAAVIVAAVVAVVTAEGRARAPAAATGPPLGPDALPVPGQSSRETTSGPA